MSIGIPIKLLHEAEGHTVSVELTTGATYRGRLVGSEDNMNVQLRDVVATEKDGKVSRIDQLYLRGSQVRFVVVPDMLENSPILQPKSR